jgi:hypothetical protein
MHEHQINEETPPGRLTPTEQRAALLVTERSHRRTFYQIAEEIGIDVATLWRWRQRPDFAARVEREQRRRAAEWERKCTEEREARSRAQHARFLAELAADEAAYRQRLFARR